MKSSKGVFLCVPIPFGNTIPKNVHLIGSAGGWTKASTGFTFKNINRKTIALVDHISADKPLNRFAKKSLLVVRLAVFGCFIQQQPHGRTIVFRDVWQK